MTKNDRLAKQLADAIQRFRQLPMVGEYLDGDDAPDWCPIRCTFHIAAPRGDP